jgi:uncharacterized protein (UPF0332 family)
MEKWLLGRLFDTGDQPVPRFAYQSTVNWMAGLAIKCEADDFGSEKLRNFYSNVQRRSTNTEADTWVFENIVMALHNVAALNQMNAIAENKTSIVRAAIIEWYYAVYYSSSAMVAASSGSKQRTHASTAKVWQNDIVSRQLVVSPFELSLDTLVEKDVKEKVAQMRAGNTYKLTDNPTNNEEAWGCICGYVSGTANYEKSRTEERVKTSSEFRNLNVSDFRKRDARSLRDSQLKKGYVNFLIQAFRYRGKANYRDSIYLSYGENREESIEKLVKSLKIVATSFVKMASHYCERRVESGTWELFSADLVENLKIEIEPLVYAKISNKRFKLDNLQAGVSS